jgi:hypothetical protein
MEDASANVIQADFGKLSDIKRISGKLKEFDSVAAQLRDLCLEFREEIEKSGLDYEEYPFISFLTLSYLRAFNGNSISEFKKEMNAAVISKHPKQNAGGSL